MSITPHPSLPEFDYIHPMTLAEASDFLARHPDDARPLLGGTDLLVRMRDGFLHARYLVDVKHLDGTQLLYFNPGEESLTEPGLTIGAAVNMNAIIASPEVQAHYPLLAEACRSVASYQLRTRATLAGNLCNASPAGDTIGACLVFQGSLNVHGTHGLRQEPISSFFLGPGKTRLQPGDIVTSLHFPLPPPESRGIYLKLGRNKLSDLAIVGVTVLGYPDASAGSGFRFRIALASVAPVPLLTSQAETYLAEHALNPETILQAAQLAADACTPIDDVRGSARYRRAMVRNLTHRGLEAVSRQLSHADSLP
jgi:aerobic carbon-monoxide dehydrogenase medium subunit